MVLSNALIIQPIGFLIAGVLTLIAPRLLDYIVAFGDYRIGAGLIR